MTGLADLPEGTVTFLFTDLEGSTTLLQAHPAAYRDAVRRHHALLLGAVEAAGGVVFETVGDAVYAAFARPTDAVAAALAGQRALQAEPWGETGPLRARMGVHLGEVELQGGHYFGAPLYRCARLTGTAHGGQVVLSAAVAEVVREALPEGAGLRDLGAHRLKDLLAPERVAQLTHQGLPAAFPPLRSLDARPNNLPRQLTSFVGRERELAEVARLLAGAPLLTLTGPGGTGKTRLALHAAADALEAYPDGVWLVELGALADPALVPAAMAAAVGVREEPGRPLLATLTDALREKRLLLVLDNCEHLLDACARLADGLLRAGPQVRLLCTSREALGIAGETVWRVPSLPIPAAGGEDGEDGEDGAPPPAAPAAGGFARYAAVRLFCERAAAVRPGFALTAESAPAVAQVCVRLDGIPLAIELAAARVRVLPPRQLLARLDDRFRLLTGGSRTALERHQTLQAAVDWSYDLLDERERALFARLAVFAGGFTLEAAEQVGAGAEAWEVLDLLTRLVDRSLVVAEEQGGEARYRLLETLHQYALGKLAASGEGGLVRARHAAHYLALAAAAAPELRGARGAVWLARLRRDLDNVRAALAWAEAQGEADLGLRLAAALLWVWAWHHRAEGRTWLTRLLALPAPVDGAAPPEAAATRVRALNAAGLVASVLGESDEARDRFEAALALARETGDAAGTGWALLGLGLVADGRGDAARARALAEQSLAVCLAADDRLGVANAHRLLGMAARGEGDHPGAARAGERALALYRELGDLPGAAFAVCLLGDAALEQGDLAEARRRYEEALALFRGSADDASGTAFATVELARVAFRAGDHAAARSHFREGLRLYHARGWRRLTAEVLAALAVVAAGEGARPRALRLAGAASGLRETAGGRPPAWLVPAQAHLEEALATARRELGEPAAAAAWEAGQAMTPEQAVADALADAPDAAG